jgi:hypothetical protein
VPDAHPLKAEEWEEIVSSLLRMRSFAEELDRMLDILGYQNPAERTLQS